MSLCSLVRSIQTVKIKSSARNLDQCCTVEYIMQFIFVSRLSLHKDYEILHTYAKAGDGLLHVFNSNQVF